MGEHELALFLPLANDMMLRVLTVEANEYLPLLRARYPRAEIFAVTGDEDEARQGKYDELDVSFDILDYHETVLPYEKKSLDIIIAPLCLETAANPQDIAAGFGTYIKDTGFLLTSFNNIRYHRVIAELMDGRYHYLVRRLFTRKNFEILLMASFYKNVTFSPIFGKEDEPFIKKLSDVGFKNYGDDLSVVTWLVKADKSMPSIAAIKSRYTPGTRRELVTLLRRIEYGIDSAANGERLRELCEREKIDDEYLRDFIEETVFYKGRLQKNREAALHDVSQYDARDYDENSEMNFEHDAGKTVAFITCVNDEAWYSESLLYQKSVRLPEGFTAEYIAVRGASSMAAGYNEAMRKSKARYKIYLHQDTLIVNHNLIDDLIEIFADEKIGAVGVIGCRSLPASGVWWDGLRVYGRVLHACEAESIVDSEVREPNGDAIDVEAVDGLFIATQYDIEWREDLFTGWHLYDASQCLEFRRRGYRVAIPNQSDGRGGFWCIHCPTEKPLAKEYKGYQKIFLQEYGGELNPEV